MYIIYCKFLVLNKSKHPQFKFKVMYTGHNLILSSINTLFYKNVLYIINAAYAAININIMLKEF